MKEKELINVSASQMSLGFNLREPKANKSTQVYAVVRLGCGKHLKFCMGKLNTWEWDAQREIPIFRERMNPKDRANAMNVFRRISVFRFGYYDFFSYLCDVCAVRLTADEIRKELNNRTTVTSQTITISNVGKITTTNMNRGAENLVHRGGHKRATTIIKKAFLDYQKRKTLSEGSVREYSRFVKYFCDYCKEKGDSIKRLSQAGIEEYQEYLMKKGESNNQVNRKCKGIERVVNNGILNKAKLGLTNISTATLHVEKKDKEDEVRRPLTDAEVSKLEQCKGLKPKLREWSDLFLLQIYCGCRNSDLHRFFDATKHRTDEIDGETIISFKTTKSQEKLTQHVRVTPKIEAILNRYSGGFQFVKFNVKRNAFNKMHTTNIRRFAQQAGLVSTERFIRDGKQVTAPLYEVIAGHFGRYTFVHKNIAVGYTPDEVAPMTGHKDGKQIREVYGVLDHNERTTQVISTIKRVAGRNAQTQANTKALDQVKEYQDVLRFFGCPYDDFRDITDIEELIRLIVTRYEIPLTTGFDYTKERLKQVYNNRNWEEQDRIHEVLYEMHTKLSQ